MLMKKNARWWFKNKKKWLTGYLLACSSEESDAIRYVWPTEREWKRNEKGREETESVFEHEKEDENEMMKERMRRKWKNKKKKNLKRKWKFFVFFSAGGNLPVQVRVALPCPFLPPSFHQYPSSSFYQFPPTPHLLLVLVNQCPTTPWPPPWSFLDGNLSLRLPLQRSSRPQPFRLCVRVSFFFSLSTGPDWQ